MSHEAIRGAGTGNGPSDSAGLYRGSLVARAALTTEGLALGDRLLHCVAARRELLDLDPKCLE